MKEEGRKIKILKVLTTRQRLSGQEMYASGTKGQ